MVATLEFNDGVATGDTACQSYGAHGGLGARIHHPHFLDRWHETADQIGQFDFEPSRCPET